jgi:AmmeMemoRadiSam system protein A
LDELQEIEIEVSVLTEPRQLAHSDPQSLLAQLVPGKTGVILQSGFRSATYLPQVWDQLPAKREFLSSLCRKGGNALDCWTHPSTQVSTYEVEKFSESDFDLQ